MALETALSGWAWPVLKSVGRLTGVTYEARTTQGGASTDTVLDAQFNGFSTEEVDNSLVLATDQRILLRKSDLAVRPTRHDTLVETVEGTTWLIMRILRGKPDLGIYWHVHCRER